MARNFRSYCLRYAQKFIGRIQALLRTWLDHWKEEEEGGNFPLLSTPQSLAQIALARPVGRRHTISGPDTAIATGCPSACISELCAVNGEQVKMRHNHKPQWQLLLLLLPVRSITLRAQLWSDCGRHSATKTQRKRKCTLEMPDAPARMDFTRLRGFCNEQRQFQTSFLNSRLSAQTSTTTTAFLAPMSNGSFAI